MPAVSLVHPNMENSEFLILKNKMGAVCVLPRHQDAGPETLLSDGARTRRGSLSRGGAGGAGGASAACSVRLRHLPGPVTLIQTLTVLGKVAWSLTLSEPQSPHL